MKRKLLIIAIILLVVLVGGTIAIKMFRKHKRNSNPIGVYSVSYYTGYGMMDTAESYSGSVSSNGDQSVVLDNTKTLKEVLASEGDAVEAGDVLLTYDTYKDSLQLDSMYSQLAVYNTNMTIAKKALTKLQNTTPVEKKEGPAAEEPADEASENDAATDDITDDATDGDAEETYTKEELELAIKKKNDEINSIQNSIDNQNLSIRKQERKISKGSVVAEADGVVVKVDMSDENIASGFPVIVVSSEGTYSTTVSVGEMDIDSVNIGDEATVYCYDTGEMYMGKVVSIGTSPNGTTSYPCVQSTYPVKISLSDVEDMVDEAYVEVTINGSAEDFEGGGGDDIMLPLFLTKKDNGGYFVMKEVDGRLKKQYIETGKIYYGSQIVVKSGITSEDYIAFPYEKEAVEGKVTVHKENDDLY